MNWNKNITLHLDNLKFSASILANQEPFLKFNAISFNSSLVLRSASNSGDIFLNNLIKDLTIGDDDFQHVSMLQPAINNSHAKTSEILRHA